MGIDKKIPKLLLFVCSFLGDLFKLGSRNYISQKVAKMGSIIGLNITLYGAFDSPW